MFLLIAPVEDKPFNPFENRGWNMMQRETKLNLSILEQHKKQFENPLINNENFEELSFSQDGSLLIANISGDHSFVPCPPPGEYDAVEQLANEVEELETILLNEDLGIEKLLFDFSRVDSMSSEILNIFVALNKNLKPSGIEIEFYGLSPELAEVMKITKLDSMFKIKK